MSVGGGGEGRGGAIPASISVMLHSLRAVPYGVHKLFSEALFSIAYSTDRSKNLGGAVNLKQLSVAKKKKRDFECQPSSLPLK